MPGPGRPRKVVITPVAGAKYDYKIIEVQDRELSQQTAAEQQAGKSQCETKLDELGQDHWLLVHSLHVGSNINYLFLVREVE